MRDIGFLHSSAGRIDGLGGDSFAFFFGGFCRCGSATMGFVPAYRSCCAAAPCQAFRAACVLNRRPMARRMLRSIIYDSNTGNTLEMAELIRKGAESTGDEIYFAKVQEADPSKIAASGIVFLGCPATGKEKYTAPVKKFLFDNGGVFSGRTVYLFGSCSRGEGLWLERLAEALRAEGAVLSGENLISIYAPNEWVSDRCMALGAVRP